jgi:LysR family glycine cleavage system transcriptional activator
MLRLPSTAALACLESSARLGSFTAAARELHLTQGAVSRQVIGLEQRLGTPLFLRRKQQLQLTDAGRAYLEEVGPLLQRLERATANVIALQGRGGALSVCVSASLGSYWLIPRLPAFTREHPEITLNLATRVGPADFASMAIDASIEFGDGQRPMLRNDFILPLQLSPYASPAWIAQHGRRIGEATPRRLLIRHTTVPEAWGGWFEAAGVAADPGQEGPRYDLMSMALNAATAGIGAVLLPEFMAEDAVAQGRLKRLSKRSWRAPRSYHMVYPEAAARLPSLRAFLEWLRRQAAGT